MKITYSKENINAFGGINFADYIIPKICKELSITHPTNFKSVNIGFKEYQISSIDYKPWGWDKTWKTTNIKTLYDEKMAMVVVCNLI